MATLTLEVSGEEEVEELLSHISHEEGDYERIDFFGKNCTLIRTEMESIHNIMGGRDIPILTVKFALEGIKIKPLMNRKVYIARREK